MLKQDKINTDVKRLLEKRIEQLKRSIEKSLTPEQLKDSRWVVYGKNEFK